MACLQGEGIKKKARFGNKGTVWFALVFGDKRIKYNFLKSLQLWCCLMFFLPVPVLYRM